MNFAQAFAELQEFKAGRPSALTEKDISVISGESLPDDGSDLFRVLADGLDPMRAWLVLRILREHYGQIPPTAQPSGMAGQPREVPVVKTDGFSKGLAVKVDWCAKAREYQALYDDAMAKAWKQRGG